MTFRVGRVLVASLIISTTVSASIVTYRNMMNETCIDDLSELEEVAANKTKKYGQVAVNFNQVYFDKQKNQWCYQSEMD